MNSNEKTRFDTRLSKEQKDFFEYAAHLGGFRTLTEFILHAVQQQASEIVEKHQSILDSKRDREIFFEAILNPPSPNESLKKAATSYQKSLPAQ